MNLKIVRNLLEANGILNEILEIKQVKKQVEKIKYKNQKNLTLYKKLSIKK